MLAVLENLALLETRLSWSSRSLSSPHRLSVGSAAIGSRSRKASRFSPGSLPGWRCRPGTGRGCDQVDPLRNPQAPAQGRARRRAAVDAVARPSERRHFVHPAVPSPTAPPRRQPITAPPTGASSISAGTSCTTRGSRSSSLSWSRPPPRKFPDFAFGADGGPGRPGPPVLPRHRPGRLSSRSLPGVQRILWVPVRLVARCYFGAAIHESAKDFDRGTGKTGRLAGQRTPPLRAGHGRVAADAAPPSSPVPHVSQIVATCALLITSALSV